MLCSYSFEEMCIGYRGTHYVAGVAPQLRGINPLLAGRAVRSCWKRHLRQLD